MSLRSILIFILAIGLPCHIVAQQQAISKALNGYLSNYTYEGFRERASVEKININQKDEEITVYITEPFASQHFTTEKIDSITDAMQALLPQGYEDYELKLYCDGYPIEELCWRGRKNSDYQRTWEANYKDNDWVSNENKPYRITHGLQHRHLSVTASHGSFFDLDKQLWRWQRPYLFCTTEDLLTQTIVVPYLIPMLERAGAIVYSTRERDWQCESSIIDNDTPMLEGTYQEISKNHPWEDAATGFANWDIVWTDSINPFKLGTSRKVATQAKRRQMSEAVWTPLIHKDGKYAVYVSYSTLPTSVKDAKYIVRHKGITTRFMVNQQMGGGTWVYLGTFEFAANKPLENNVSLSNYSDFRGHITADAVRFGGGMGNIVKGKARQGSGLPRFLEGARYNAVWSGMPLSVYGNKQFTNDYNEDINTRSLMTNHIARGSVYLPGDSGLSVPIEACIGIHSDAGCRSTPEIIGTLGICTTHFQDGYYPSGLTRLVARDFCDAVLSEIDRDLHAHCSNWNRRQIYDRNYSESREPLVPGIIIETLSHQNFYDMALMHDPTFKFILARAIYKGILRTLNALHDKDNYVVAPLPVCGLSVMYTSKNTVKLRWEGVEDGLEPSASPTGYVVYHAQGEGDFDNGTYVDATRLTLEDLPTATLHRFKVSAVNAGGESLSSTEVCCYLPEEGSKKILIIDAFSRLAGPQPIDNDSIQGFDLENEPGSPIAVMPGYCGRQLDWNKIKIGQEGPGGLGFSSNELEGMLIAGNTLDWSTRHAVDIIKATHGAYAISSCTVEALKNLSIERDNFCMLDIVGGLQKADGYSLRQQHIFTPSLIQTISAFQHTGGNVLVSGAFVGSDMTSEIDRAVTRSLLKYEGVESLHTDSTLGITGLGQTSMQISTDFNEQQYRVASVDCLAPVDGSFCAAVYSSDDRSAVVAYDGKDFKTLTFGFPIESIKEDEVRLQLWLSILSFLVK